MKASEIASLASYRASGPAVASASPSRRTSGYGSSHGIAPSLVGSGAWTPGGGQSVCGRRRAERSAFRLRVVAIRYSHVRTEARPSKLPSPCQAASRASCRTSSASLAEPRIR
jgi:hypothetical protein